MQRSRLWSEKKDAIDGAFFQIAGHTFQIVCHTFQPPTFMLRIPKAVDNLTVIYVFIVGGHSVEIQTLTDPKSLTLLLCHSFGLCFSALVLHPWHAGYICADDLRTLGWVGWNGHDGGSDVGLDKAI